MNDLKTEYICVICKCGKITRVFRISSFILPENERIVLESMRDRDCNWNYNEEQDILLCKMGFVRNCFESKELLEPWKQWRKYKIKDHAKWQGIITDIIYFQLNKDIYDC